MCPLKLIKNSFSRTSPWDVKENLPIDYARIFQFKSFDQVKRRIIKEATKVEITETGQYYTVHVANVPCALWDTWKQINSVESKAGVQHLILYGLLPHEHKMCTVNVVLKRLPGSEIPLKSKERLIVQCGFRRFAVNPIFSAHTNGDKHKVSSNITKKIHILPYFSSPLLT